MGSKIDRKYTYIARDRPPHSGLLVRIHPHTNYVAHHTFFSQSSGHQLTSSLTVDSYADGGLNQRTLANLYFALEHQP